MALSSTQSQEAVTAREVEEMRSRVRRTLDAAQQRAQASGRPLLILSGESHGNSNSALLNMIIYEEARRLGVRDLAIELPARETQQSRALLTAPISRLFLQGRPLLYRQSQFYGDRTHMVDGRRYLSEESLRRGGRNLYLAARDETMAANLARIAAPALMLTGSAHLPGLENRMARHNTHTVVSFSTDPVFSEGSHATRDVLTLRGNTQSMDDDTLLGLGMGQAATAFLAWGARTGAVLSEAVRNQILARPLAITSSDIVAIGQRVNALYDARRDHEAGMWTQQFVRLCTTQRPAEETAAGQACFSHLRNGGYRGVSGFSADFLAGVRAILPNELERSMDAAVPLPAPNAQRSSGLSGLIAQATAPAFALMRSQPPQAASSGQAVAPFAAVAQAALGAAAPLMNLLGHTTPPSPGAHHTPRTPAHHNGQHAARPAIAPARAHAAPPARPQEQSIVGIMMNVATGGVEGALAALSQLRPGTTPPHTPAPHQRPR